MVRSDGRLSVETADLSDPGLMVTDSATSYSPKLPNGGLGATVSLQGESGSSASIFEATVPCFAAGTRILTARREVLVEDLTVGELIVTPTGEMLPVIWIGSRHINCRRHPQPSSVYPVRIQADAFELNQPASDLFLSPDHAVFAEGVLIPIRYLLNGKTVRQMKTLAVTYFHVELLDHSIIFANGLPCESYLDTGDRHAFANAGSVVSLHPSFGL